MALLSAPYSVYAYVAFTEIPERELRVVVGTLGDVFGVKLVAFTEIRRVPWCGSL
jgi:hypothetical protein